ncbi:MAG: SPOR domain-containing protein [Rubrivivax sp.]
MAAAAATAAIGAAATAPRAQPPRASPRDAAAGGGSSAGNSAGNNTGAGGTFAVQAGAFRIEASAQALRADIAARLAGSSGLSASESVVRVVERDGVHRVFVGALDSLAAARSLRARLRGIIGDDAFATRP